MTTATAVVLVLAGVFAIGNWVSRLAPVGNGWAIRLEYLCKPATLGLLVVAAILLEPESSSMRAWFVVALIFSLAGDVFLMLPSDRFVEGLGSFLVGHLAYVAGFVASGLDAGRLAAGLAAVIVVIVPVGAKIVPGAQRSDPRLAIPVALYISVISAMIISSVGSGRVVAIVGAGLFAFSDSLIGWTRFVNPIRRASVIIMVTYHLGQVLLLLSLV
jgi:uncharacterized membrane protein YhhN